MWPRAWVGVPSDTETLKRQADGGTAQLVAALEDAWRTIGATHLDLPPAAIIVGQGSGRRGGGLVLGHFAAERWQHTHTPDAAGTGEAGTCTRC